MNALFDFDFKNFITPKILKIVYIVLLISVTISALSMLVYAFSAGSFSMILFGILSSIIYFVIGVLIARISVEFVYVVFGIYENTTKIANKD